MILMVLGIMTSIMFWLNLQLPIPTAFMVMNLLGIVTSLLIVLIGVIDESEFLFSKKTVKETARQVKKTTV